MNPKTLNHMSAYFNDIWSGMSTILLGMWVTFRHLFTPAVTVQYPRETLKMSPIARARLVNHEADCSVCLACQRACPVNIITIKGARAEKDEDLGLLPGGKPKRMHLLQYDIDMSRCVYCGLCVDACDETHSLRWEQPQEPSVFTRRELYIPFSTMPEALKRELLEREEQRKRDRAAAAAKPKPAGAPKPSAKEEEKSKD